MPAVSSPTVGQALLEPQLLLELLHRGQIGEQADGAVQLAVVVEERRDSDAESRCAPVALGQSTPCDERRRARRETFVDDLDSAGSPISVR